MTGSLVRVFGPWSPNHADIKRVSLAFPEQMPPSPVDIRGFVCYMPALRVKGQAFAGPSLYQNSYPIN